MLGRSGRRDPKRGPARLPRLGDIAFRAPRTVYHPHVSTALMAWIHGDWVHGAAKQSEAHTALIGSIRVLPCTFTVQVHLDREHRSHP